MLLAANTCFYAHLPTPRAAPAEFRMLGPSDSPALCAIESRHRGRAHHLAMARAEPRPAGHPEWPLHAKDCALRILTRSYPHKGRS